jgi:hypothetical protein
MAKYKFYTGDPVFVNKEEAHYYIHKRKRDIGRAAHGNSMSDKDIASVFSRQKEQAGEAAKTFYKTLFLENLKVSDPAMELLNNVFEEDRETIIKEIDKQVKEKLQSAINEKELSKLMTSYREASKASKDLLSEPTKAAASFNTVLQCLIDASNLIHGPHGATLAGILSLYKEQWGPVTTLTEMGEVLSYAVSGFVRQFPMIYLDQAKIIDVITALDRLATTFITGKTSKNKDVLPSNITNIVDSVFSSGFSELIGSQIETVAGLKIEEELAKLKGTDQVQIQKTDLKGYLNRLTGRKAAGKTDILFPEVGVTIDKSEATPEGGHVKMNIGISNKFYRTYGFHGAHYNGQTLHFSSGSGGSLKEALQTLFETNWQHYLAYNTLFQGSESLPAATVALQDILLTRQISRLFATRGGAADFSQYVIVNGQVVSIWDLIMYAIDNNVGASTSMDKRGSQAVVLHIDGRKDIFNYSREINARKRVPGVNKAINKATIMATVRVEKLAEAIPKTEAIVKE